MGELDGLRARPLTNQALEPIVREALALLEQAS
jgi:hypothetical protein